MNQEQPIQSEVRPEGKRLHLLFLSDNFPPERNAPSSRTYEHAHEWVKLGHRVTVVTTAPNFPEGRLLDGYKNRWWHRETIDGIEVIRVKTFITANEGVLLRTLDYVSFMVSGALAALFVRRPDVVVATSPQFFCAVGAWIVSGLRRLPWVFEVRDLWPASIVAVGAMRRNLLLRMIEALEMRLYRSADVIVAVTQGIIQNLVHRGIDAGKIVLVTNGVRLDKYTPGPKPARLLDRYGLHGKFVAGYLGNVGMSTCVENIVDAAALLRHRTDIAIFIAGSGARWTAVRDRANALGLDNLVIAPGQPKDEMPDHWRMLDVAILSMRDEPLFKGTISSKMFEAMGAGLPLVVSLPEGETSQIVLGAEAGVAVPPQSPQALADAIERLADDPDRVRRYAGNSLRTAPRFRREALAQKMIDAISDMLLRRAQTRHPAPLRSTSLPPSGLSKSRIK